MSEYDYVPAVGPYKLDRRVFVMKFNVVTGLAAVGAIALIVAGSATARPEAATANVIRIVTTMNSVEEVPKPTGNVDNARGAWAGRLTRAGSGADLSWTLSFSGLTGPAVAAHIHTGQRGSAGPVAVPLCNPCTSPDTGNANVNAATLAAIQNGTAYVNVHTAMNAGGEIRGQLEVTAAISARRLGPRQEIPRPKGKVRRARGSFRGTVFKSGNTGELQWRMTFSRLTGRARAAHLHLGAAGSTGRVIVPLCGPCKSGVARTSRLRAPVMEALEDGLVYVNVHTRRNPRGEIRAQIGLIPLSMP